MNILHVNNVDLIGGRFNGHDMQRALNQMGHTAHQVVMDKMGTDPHTVLLASLHGDQYLCRRIVEGEKRLSLHAMLYPYLFRMMDDPIFKASDVVHYHLLHNYFGSLPLLSQMTALKPSVLTVHDPWIFTGHCIYPRECNKWMTGCGDCLHLDDHFPMGKDRTALHWRIKKDTFAKAELDLVVASSYMMDLVKNSPITKHVKHVHLIPFGIDTNRFSPSRNQKEIRRRWGIPEENNVLCFRADPGKYKGYNYICKMLDRMDINTPTTLLAVGQQEVLSKYSDRFQIVDLGWVTDDDLMADVYCACDVFLMPSTEEAFGLMAIEAMASGRPVICFEGTSLPAVTFAPECGIAVPKKDAGALLAAVKRLLESPEERRARGELGRRLAEKYYRFEDYVERHIYLYEEILFRRKSEKRHRKMRQNG